VNQPVGKDKRGRPLYIKPLEEEWGPLSPVPPLEDAVKMLVEHEKKQKRIWQRQHSPIAARNARIIRERLIATVVAAYNQEIQ
jgi:hypothetical protein